MSKETHEFIQTLFYFLAVIAFSVSALWLFDVILLPLVFAFLVTIISSHFEKKISYILGAVPNRRSKSIILLSKIISLLCILLIIYLAVLIVSDAYQEIQVYQNIIGESLSKLKSKAFRFLNLNSSASSSFTMENVVDVAKSLTLSGADLLQKITLFVLFYGFLLFSPPSVFRFPLVLNLSEKLAKYYIVKACIGLATSTVVAITLISFGHPHVWLIASMTFALNFIPNIGSIIAVLLPIPISIGYFDSFSADVIAMYAIIASTQFILGNVVEPKLTGDLFKLHPVTVLIFLAFFGAIWGPLGLFIGAPIGFCILELIKKSEVGKYLKKGFRL